jgi:hypothetical protein
MHEGCSASFTSGKQVVDKVRMMGFSSQRIPSPLTFSCTSCGQEVVMEHFETACQCRMVYGVTPCHSFSADHVQAAGIDY